MSSKKITTPFHYLLLLSSLAVSPFVFAVDTDGDGVEDLATVTEGFETALSPAWTLTAAARNTSAKVTGSWGLRASTYGYGSVARTIKLTASTTITWYQKKTLSSMSNGDVSSQSYILPMTCSSTAPIQCSTTLAAGSYRLSWAVNAARSMLATVYQDVDDIVIPNVEDNCPLEANSDQADTDLDGLGNACDSDDDNDTIVDGSDNCPLNANADQADTDGDGLPDACTDTDDDDDGVADASDHFPLHVAASSDSDWDDVPDSWNVGCDVTCQSASGLALDNCPSNANEAQVDTDGDGQGAACDTDDDSDDVLDAVDSYPQDASRSAADTGMLAHFYGNSAGDFFGYSVSAAGDINNDGYVDLVVGAYSADNNGSDSGSVRVLSGANGSILYTFNGDSAGDYFGYSVSAAGDVNNDGFADVIVGAFKDGGNSGSARVFSGANGSVLYTFNGDSGEDYFGRSVSGAGDVNNDGFADVIVGADGDDNNGSYSGSARVLSGANGSILYTFNGDSGSDLFGYSVSAAGDVNADGFDDVIVGAWRDGNNGIDSGSARVLSGANGNILYTFNGDSSYDYFGQSVSDAGDVNNDGYADVIVGANGDDDNGSDSGSARVFSGANGSILYTFNGDSASDNFGRSVSGAGDVNNDGFSDVIVGAYYDDNNGYSSGSARVFSGANGNILYTFNGDSASDYFGFAVSGVGDVNNDGYADLLVGAYGDDNNGADSGSARLFSGKAAVTDSDNDGTTDTLDADDDNDGVVDASDVFPRNAAESLDTDSDGVGNNADLDDDNDSVPDYIDAEPLNAANAAETVLPLNSSYKGSQLKDQVHVQ